MTKEKLKQTGEALIALSNGKHIEYNNGCGFWYSVKECTLETPRMSIMECISCSHGPLEFRIKPQKQKRLITISALPLNCVISHSEGVKGYCRVLAIDPTISTLWFYSQVDQKIEGFQIEQLINAKWSGDDGKTWNSFFVEVEG